MSVFHLALYFALLLDPFAAQVPMGGVTGGTSGGGGGITVTSIITATTLSFSSPYTIPITSAVPAGDDVVFYVGGENTTADALTLADFQNNCSGYATRLAQIDTSSSVSLYVFECTVTTSLTTSDHFTLTAPTDGHWGIAATAVAGITSGFDNVVGNNQTISNATQTSGTYTPGHANEAVQACFTTVTGVPAGYGNIISSSATGIATTGSFDGRYLACEYRIINSTTAGTATLPVSPAGFSASGILGSF